jgi:tRNA pseudouridine38-40 synthase
MARYRFLVEYLGTAFCGWQSQTNGNSVQQTLEKALGICLRDSICVTGAGRTDAGVHAAAQAAHFDYDGELDAGKVENSINGLTPKSLFIRKLESCDKAFHARHSALERHYLYTIALRPSALDYGRVWASRFNLNPDRFHSELESVRGDHDFNRFSIPRHDGKSTRCRVNLAELEIHGDRFLIRIAADRFLHKMVRSIVGACYDVARNKKPCGLIKSILNEEFSGEWTWAPAHGLCLQRVKYKDYED